MSPQTPTATQKLLNKILQLFCPIAIDYNVIVVLSLSLQMLHLYLPSSTLFSREYLL